MKRRLACCGLLLLVNVAALAQTPGPSLVGTYELSSWANFAEDGSVSQRRTIGRIVYDTEGNMAAQLMPEGYAERAAEAAPGQRQRGYVAYFGRYTVDPTAGTVTHHVAGSVLGQWVGRNLVRYYELEGDTLALSLKNEEGRVTGALTWRRLSD